MSSQCLDLEPSAHRPACPRCGSRRVIRWGRFRCGPPPPEGQHRTPGGQPGAGVVRRYRCGACTRTFTEHTGTPVAYLKRRDRWGSFCHAARRRHTVRGCAARLGIHRNTAFRWRHRLLSAARTGSYRPSPFGSVPSLPLRGRVTVGDFWLYHSEKGKRPLGRPPVTYRPRSQWLDEPRAWVILALDNGGRVFGDVVGLRRPNADALEETLRPRIARGAVVRSREGRFGAPSVVARRLGLGWEQYRGGGWPPPPPGAEPDLQTHVRELRRWLRPFKGVATRYLGNYVAWYQLAEVDTSCRGSATSGVARRAGVSWSGGGPGRRSGGRRTGSRVAGGGG